MNLALAGRQLLLKNRRRQGKFQYTVPSPQTYPYQWLWDSCFHAIILSHFDLSSAKKEVAALVSRQFQNGMIPHMIYWKNLKYGNFPRIKWGQTGTSTITQPPMLAFAVWQIFQKDKDTGFLHSVYPHLYHFYRYLLTERDPHENHLIGIMNPDESGEDNSPRFDLALKLPAVQTLEENTRRRLKLVAQNIACNFDAPFCMRNFFWVKDVPFNAMMVANLKLLAKIAGKLGLGEDSDYFRREAENIAAAMRKLMLEDQIFWSTYGQNYQKIKVKTWAIFTPLFAEILTPAEAKVLTRDHLLNRSEFWTDFPVPTTAIDEPAFDPRAFWRGPAWIGANWFIYQGLKNYGFYDTAKAIKSVSAALIQKSGFREYFNPLTGEGLGAQNFTWGALVIDMN